MGKMLGLVVGAAGLIGASMSAAGAMPIAPAATFDEAPAVTLVSGGCGPFGHRGFYGGCRPNGGYGYGYRRPAYGYGYGRPGYGGGGRWYGRRCLIRPTPYGPRRICRW